MQDYLPPNPNAQAQQSQQPQQPQMQLRLIFPKEPVDPETLVNYKGEVLITKLFIGNYVDESYCKLLHKNPAQDIIYNSGMVEQ